MSLRANFKQAINELSGSGAKTENPTVPENSVDQLQQADQTEQENVFMESEKPGYAKQNATSEAKVQSSQTVETATATAASKKSAEPAVITADSQIHGAIVTKSPLIVQGKVKGNILCEETVRLTGEIEGNVTAMSIEIKGAAIKGDLRMKYTAVLEEGSTLNGNLEAESAVINGNVNGDMRVHGNLKIMQNSKINGDIIAGSLEIAKGAVISGKVAVASEDPNAKKSDSSVTNVKPVNAASGASVNRPAAVTLNGTARNEEAVKVSAAVK